MAISLVILRISTRYFYARDIEGLSLLLEVQGTKLGNQLNRQNAAAYRSFQQIEARGSQMERHGASSEVGASAWRAC